MCARPAAAGRVLGGHRWTIIARRLFDRWTLLILLLAAAPLIRGAARYTVFDDEAFSCRRYVMPIGEMVSALWRGVEPDPPLYYLLINGWTRLFGVGPPALRSLSIILFLAALPIMRQAGEAWFGRRAGILAMLLSALHPAHLFFGFAARWYALVFLLTAVLLWLTAAPRRTASALNRGSDTNRTAAWSLVAAALAYTNTFGLVMAGWCWVVGAIRDTRSRYPACRWPAAAVLAVVLYLPWLPAVIRQYQIFQESGGSWGGWTSTAARTTLALLTGNLASPEAWWAWAPMAVAAVGLVALLRWQGRQAWSVLLIAGGTLLVGVMTRAMIDKYILTLSGGFSLLAAGLLAGAWEASRSTARRMIQRATITCLVCGWLGCMANLTLERHWSSLRWLDPMAEVTQRLFVEWRLAPRTGAVAAPVITSHPSARYYFALYEARHAAGDTPERAAWAVAFDNQNRTADSAPGPALTPSAILPRLDGPLPPTAVVTLQTAGFTDLPDWQVVEERLARGYELQGEERHLYDSFAAWKDRLDPAIHHPVWRVTVRWWRLRQVD